MTALLKKYCGCHEYQLFDILYDWDSGMWKLVVDALENGKFVREYDSEGDAEKGKIELMKRLATAPEGNVLQVLAEWEIHGLRGLDPRKA